MLVLLLACSREIDITQSQGGCTDFSYESPAPPELRWEPLADGAVVSRTNILLPEAGLDFAPDLDVDRGVVTLVERWIEPESDDQFCYTASVLFQGFTGELEVRWYLEGEEVPFDTLLIEEP